MTVKTTVSEVKIYRSSAIVSRNGTMELEKGNNLVYISGMTNTAVKDSFSLAVSGRVSATNLQVVENNAVETKLMSAELKKQIEDLDYHIHALDTVMKLREMNGDFSGRSDISVEAQEKYMEELPKQLLKLREESKILSEKKKKLESDLEQALQDEKRPLIMAELVAEESGYYIVQLQYQEAACKWIPKYEIRYNGSETPLSVSMKALIKQSSGEDWRKVRISLYSGNPVKNQELPAVRAVQLSLAGSQPYPGSRYLPATGFTIPVEAGETSVLNADADITALCALTELNHLEAGDAEISDGTTMKEFILPYPKDVLNGTDGNIVDLQSFDVPAIYRILSIPSQSRKCFLTAKVKPQDWPLPPANASVFVNNTFVGINYVNPGSAKEYFQISLGEDERIVVERTEKTRETQDVFIKNQKRQLCGFSVFLINNSSESLPVLVKDVIPVSTDKVINVEVTNASNGYLNPETGLIKWDFQAEPGKQMKWDVEYAIAWPKDKRVVERSIQL